MSPAHESFLVAQAGTALGAAASQDLAAVGGSHSLAEAMDLLAVEPLVIKDKIIPNYIISKTKRSGNRNYTYTK